LGPQVEYLRDGHGFAEAAGHYDRYLGAVLVAAAATPLPLFDVMLQPV
jgi:hypothetical protein